MDSQFFFYPVVKIIQILIGEYLAGQVADGKAFSSLKRTEQVIAWKILQALLLGRGTADNIRNKFPGTSAGNNPEQLLLEDFMINTGKILAYIAFENIRISAYPAAESL